MSRSYQPTDAEIVDYELFEIPGVRGTFRGPEPETDDYIVCIGASQTFGRFVHTPFPRLLSQALEMEVLNLGRGGIGPEYHMNDPTLTERIQRARAVVVQVLSGRSQSNSLFKIHTYGMCGVNLVTGREQRADEFYVWLQSQRIELAREIVAETRKKYVAAMIGMLAAIKPPKILLWLSERTPDCEDRWDLRKWRLCGKFPQFVNREMMDRVVPHADVYVECASKRGLPQPLFDRNGNPIFFPGPDGALRSENTYYPSPEMHEDAAQLLIPACRELIHRATGKTNPHDGAAHLSVSGV